MCRGLIFQIFPIHVERDDLLHKQEGLVFKLRGIDLELRRESLRQHWSRSYQCYGTLMQKLESLFRIWLKKRQLTLKQMACRSLKKKAVAIDFSGNFSDNYEHFYFAFHLWHGGAITSLRKSPPICLYTA